MTPNPNPSPELFRKAASLVYRIEASGPIDDERTNIERWKADARALAPELRAALSPQTLPAPGEVATAVELLEHYAEFIREDVKADDLERHPYLPLIEQTIAALATVAAANDEVVARGINEDPVGTLAIRLSATANEAEEEHGEWTWREIADAAMRLLSQGGGK